MYALKAMKAMKALKAMKVKAALKKTAALKAMKVKKKKGGMKAMKATKCKKKAMKQAKRMQALGRGMGTGDLSWAGKIRGLINLSLTATRVAKEEMNLVKWAVKELKRELGKEQGVKVGVELIKNEIDQAKKAIKIMKSSLKGFKKLRAINPNSQNTDDDAMACECEECDAVVPASEVQEGYECPICGKDN